MQGALTEHTPLLAVRGVLEDLIVGPADRGGITPLHNAPLAQRN